MQLSSLDWAHRWLFYEEDSTVVCLWIRLVGLIGLCVTLSFFPLWHIILPQPGLLESPSYILPLRESVPPPSLFHLPLAPIPLWIIFGAAIISAGGIILLWNHRSCAVVLLIILSGVCNRFPALDFGGTMMLCPALLCLVFLKPHGTSTSAWPLRFIQTQLCIAYFFSAMAKCQSPDWMSGQAMANVLNSEQSLIALPWLGSMPSVTAILCYGTIVAELAFPLLVWHPYYRRPLMLLLLGMHLGIFFFLHVTVFFTEMFMVLVLSFLKREDLELCAKLLPHSPWRSARVE